MLAQVGGKAVDVAAEREQRVLGRAPRERADGGADGLGLRPSALAGPGFQSLEILFLQVDLQRAGHDRSGYVIMIGASMRS